MQIQAFGSHATEPDACIWMQAGVVKRRICLIGYDCAACRYDSVLDRESRRNQMRRRRGETPAGRRGAIVSWKERLRSLPPALRPCVHHLKGRIAFRACNRDYDCAACDFDQYFSDQLSVFAVVRPVGMLSLKGVQFPQGYYLHPGHCWVRLEEGASVRIGLDDFALKVFGPLERLAAPLVGKKLLRDEAGLQIERAGRTAGVQAPVGGVVTDVNARLFEAAAGIEAEPYAAGWVLKVSADDLRADLGRLMPGDQAAHYLDAEIESLFRMIEEEAGPLAADGGDLRGDVFGHLPQLGWEALVRSFLRT